MTLGNIALRLVESVPYGLGGLTNYIDLAVAEGGYEPKPGNGVDNVTETITIYLTQQSSITTLNRMLQMARDRKRSGVGSRIYLHAQGPVDTDWWMSELLDGQVGFTPGGVEGALTNGRAEARLTLTRRGFFESRQEVTLSLVGPHGSGTQVIVDNCLYAASSLDNHIKINEGSVAGDLPAPVRLSIYNNSAGTLARLYVARVLNHDGGEHDIIASVHYKDYSGSADAACSGGAYQSATLTTGNETDLFSKLIDFSFQRLGGDLYHVMARFRDNTSLGNVKFRLRLLSGSTEIWRGRQFRLVNTDLMQDLGVINLPPGNASLWTAVTLVISGQRTTGVTETVNLDFVNFIGREFARLECLAGLAQNQNVWYGGWDAELARWADSMTPTMDVVAYGPRSLTLIPNRPNGLFFLAQTTTPGTAEINRQLAIQAKYRPRRSSL